MTELERAINHLRFGEYGDYVESLDGTIRVTRLDRFVNTLPWCLITENGQTREATEFYGDTVHVLARIIEEEIK